MKKTLREQIQANKRGSFLFAMMMVLLIALLTATIVGISYPKYWPYGAVGGLVLASFCALIARFFGPSLVMSISGAREANDAEHRMLKNVVEEMAIAAGIPTPKIFVIEDSSPNAFATGKDAQNGMVAITTGLMYKLNRDELQGVMAHEIAHIRNLDIRYMTTVTMMGGLIGLLADWLSFKLRWGFWGRRSSDDEGPGNLVFVILGFVLMLIAPIIGFLLQMAVSRQREFLADATAAELTRYPEGLASALRKISTDLDPLEAANRATQHMYIVNPLKLGGGGSDLFSTHPDTEARIRALMGTAGYWEKQRKFSS